MRRAMADYGHAHRKERARLAPLVASGQAVCCELICVMPSRYIAPGSDWDLAHDRRTGGYLGPSHAKCNRREGQGEKTRRARGIGRWAL